MKKAITVLTLSINTLAFGQFPNDAQETISINNISAAIRTNGSLFQDDLSPGFEVPQNSGTHTFYSGSIWIGGLSSNGTTHTAAVTYAQESMQDFWAGPISDSTHYVAADTSWNRLWKVTKQDISTHIWNYWQSNYTIPEVILNWPAHGDTNKGQAPNLAPFADTNGNGIYEPNLGDYPKIKGDEAVYFILNDDRLPHTGSNGEKMRIEIHGMVYGFACFGTESLENTLFVDYSIYNRSQQTYTETSVGFFSDLDLGGYSDDFIGSDVQRSTYYVYNGDSIDTPIGGSQAYSGVPPAQGITFLSGTLQNSDGIDNAIGFGPGESTNGSGYGDGIIDNEVRGLDHFMYFTQSGASCCTSPTNAIEYNNYLHGYWKNGEQLTFGGTGIYGQFESNYMYPGTTDSLLFGTQGVDPNYVDSRGWCEEAENNSPHDRRGIGSTGSFTFEPGDVQELTIAFVFAKSDTGNQHSSVALMQQYIDEVRDMYNADTTPCGSGVFSSVKPSENEVRQSLTIYPNPTSSVLNIQGINENSPYQIFDITGKLIISGSLSQESVQVSNLTTGLYFINIEGQSQRFIKK